jgi:putative hemolysin
MTRFSPFITMKFDSLESSLEGTLKPCLSSKPLSVTVSDSRYCIRLASSSKDVNAALRLRYEVFNLELNEGLATSHATGRDEDEFDGQCLHLLACERETGAVIGAYRLQTWEIASAGAGFYSASEFALNQLPTEYLSNAIELGRACIAKPHRNLQVLFLLWKGLVQCLIHFDKQYLFGCCSLTSQDPHAGLAMERYLTYHGHRHPTLFANVLPDFACTGLHTTSEPPGGNIVPPKLFSTYLRFGAKVCSPPALDRRFQTIDFLVTFDVNGMDQRTRRIFFGK